MLYCDLCYETKKKSPLNSRVACWNNEFQKMSVEQQNLKFN